MTRTATTTNRRKVGRFRIGINSKRSKQNAEYNRIACLYIELSCNGM